MQASLIGLALDSGDYRSMDNLPFKILFNVGGKYAIAERVLMIVCFTELVNNMFEACLTFKENLRGYIFYLLTGYAVVLAHQARKKMTA